jgi:hypothetical protein
VQEAGIMAEQEIVDSKPELEIGIWAGIMGL